MTKEEYLKVVELLAFEYGYLNLKHLEKDTSASAIPYKKLIELINEHFELKELFELATQELEDFEYHYSMYDLNYAESTLFHTGNYYHTKEQWKDILKQKLLEKEVKE